MTLSIHSGLLVWGLFGLPPCPLIDDLRLKPSEVVMDRLLKIVRSALSIVSLLYIGLLVLLLIAPFLFNRPEMRGILRSILAILLFPSLLFLPLLLIFKIYRGALVMILPVLGCMFIYGPFLFPRSADATVDTQSLTVLTFNIQTAIENPESVAAIIRESSADIVAVQELSGQAADYFREALADEFPYQALYPQDNPYVGQGLLSRYPILAEEYWRNEDLGPTLGHLRVQLDINGVPVTLYNTHPVPPFSFIGQFGLQAHSGAIAILLERAITETGPVILLGDFNMTPQFDEYHQVTASYTDAFRVVGHPGLGFTYPNGLQLPLPPLVRLDYVFYNDSFRGQEAYVLAHSGSSDHLPLWVELVLLAPE